MRCELSQIRYRTWGFLAIGALVIATSQVAAASEDREREREDLGPGCAPDRPAIAHHAGAIVVRPPRGEGKAPIPCTTNTQFRTGEISIVVTKTGTAVFQPVVKDETGSSVGVLRSENQGALWDFVVPSPPRTLSVDQRMSLDRRTGRIFWIQLGLPPNNFGFTITPRLDISDDDGKTWFVGGKTLGFDDPSIFAGPPPKTASPLTLGHPNIVYACMGHKPLKCQRSIDGGLTWGSAIAIPFPAELEPLQGPPPGCAEFGTQGVVSKDGTVYVPFTPCNRPYVAISHDAGDTWTLVRVADIETIGFGALPIDIDMQGNLYAAFSRATDRLPYLTISRDGGLHWSAPLMIGAPGVTESAIPALVAGARGQVAVTYYGSPNAPRPFPPACEGASLSCPGYEKETWNTYITETWNSLDERPLFWSAILNDPARPTWYGVTPSAVGVIRVDEQFNRGPGYTQGATTGALPSGAGGRIDYFGAMMAFDDTAWVGFAQECPSGLPVAGNPNCPGSLTGTAVDGLFGFVGHLVRVRGEADDDDGGQQKIFETNITHTFSAAQDRLAGEPEVSVNPNDTQNLIMAGTAQKKHATPVFGDSVAICPLGVTFDGGRTWNLQEIPLGRVPSTSEDVCYDGFTGADRDGTLYAGGNVFPHSVATGNVRLVRSADGGRTWGAYVNAIGAATVSRFAPGIVLGTPIPFVTDRGFVAVDQSNGTVYVTTRVDSPIPSPPGRHRFVTASHDKGETFGTIYTIDSATYPGIDGWIAAAHGVLAASYPASSAPSATCPCTVFETSTDDGATWNRRIVPVPFGQLAADPVHRGRFAVLAVTSDLVPTPLLPNQVDVWVTEDFGQSWTGPAVLGEPPSTNTRFKTWLEYGPQGFLGVMWRTRIDDIGRVGVFGELNGPYEIWSALSRDGGKRFSAPLRVSQGVAPAYPLDYVGFGDDFSVITLDHKSAHIGWGDALGTDTPADPWPDIWYGRVDLSEYEDVGDGAPNEH